ncbi:E3 SUMO-protein ligase MMS21 [Physcomitrium patens]|uniref:SP-RING-type domain-containing protein n=1 Tax=Physcomitrium patens TaxID=3218 RepID=A0A2K1IP04_PHYPA|nr:E3 SUMO-protein ligase MMS21-like [Physcomitrium patens]PNR30997.1 hypothetical protein PHYPA_027313 [Physcomitrium patens]|eukprot:XP_024361144.1 E3 SUMO-protein ligase MMS21-like [Physcomitrella patens]
MYVCACCSRSLAPSLCLSGQRALVGVVVLAFLLFADAQLVVMATPAVDRVRSVIRSLASKTNDLLQDFDGTILYAKLVAEDLEKDHHAPSVKELEEATLDIITISNKLRNHSKALETLSMTYAPSIEVTDFKKLLKNYVKELDEESPFDSEKHPFIKQFREAVWKVHHAGEPMPGQEQEEIVVMAGSQALPNTSCPLSGKPVEQLEDPVRSQRCRHIYDRDAVLNYVRSHAMRNRRHKNSNPCKCAAAGCPGILVEEQLVCDSSLKIEIREYVLRQQSSNIDTVADCTYLEEDDDTPLKSHAPR